MDAVWTHSEDSTSYLFANSYSTSTSTFLKQPFKDKKIGLDLHRTFLESKQEISPHPAQLHTLLRFIPSIFITLRKETLTAQFLSQTHLVATLLLGGKFIRTEFCPLIYCLLTCAVSIGLALDSFTHLADAFIRHFYPGHHLKYANQENILCSWKFACCNSQPHG